MTKEQFESYRLPEGSLICLECADQGRLIGYLERVTDTHLTLVGSIKVRPVGFRQIPLEDIQKIFNVTLHELAPP
ncbi:hypothetical protein HY628_00235 [Candidatus Uhrbacteria bacterium]|nr:hypothetical protein [Candidatus Uhrbacteria bacterium]